MSTMVTSVDSLETNSPNPLVSKSGVFLYKDALVYARL